MLSYFRSLLFGNAVIVIVITKHFDEILLKYFRMRQLAFQMLCIEISPLVGPVKLSHRKVTCRFWCASGSLFGKSVSIIVYAHVFLWLNCFMRIFRIYVHLGVSMQHFLNAIHPKMGIKICGWKHSYCIFLSVCLCSLCFLVATVSD